MNSFLFLLSILGCCAGTEILPHGPLDAVLGKSVTFPTLVDLKDGYLVITWSFNSGSELVPVVTVVGDVETVGEGYAGRVSVNHTNAFLTLGPLESGDSGDYIISIVSKSGVTQTGEIELRVLEPVSDVTIKSNIPEAIEHNSTVVLTCSAKGSFLTFSWSRETTPIVPDSRISVKQEETSSTLTIAGVLRSDMAGRIYCMAANKLEKEKSAPFNLTVYYGPDKVSVSPLSPPKFVAAGSDFNLSCSAVSSPPAVITWYNNKALVDGSSALLTFKKMTVKQSGNYSCHAHNAKTLRTSTSAVFPVTVQEVIKGVTVTGPTATLIAGNNTANISCQVTAGSVTMRTWLKNSVPLSTSDRVVISDDKTIVMFKMVQKEDNGEYKCELANAVSKDAASYKMVVNFGPEQAKVIGKEAVEINDPVTLTCSADSVPAATYVWKFNGTVMDVKTAVYTIDKAAYKDNGVYTCEAHNAVTGKTSTSSHKLSVAEEGSLGNTLSDGAIAGIVIGILLALGLTIAIIMWCRQKVPVESPY